MAIKIYLSKTYDRLNWSFIRDTLTVLQLPATWISLIIEGVSSPSMQIL